MIKVILISDLTGGPGGVYTYLNQIQTNISEHFSTHLLLDASTRQNALQHCRFNSVDFIPLSHKFYDEELILNSVIKVFQKYKPDVVHIVNGSLRSNLIIREFLSRNKIKFIVTEQFVDDSLALDNNLQQRIQRVNLSTTHLIYVSDKNSETARVHFQIESVKHSIIYNGVTPAKKKAFYSKKPFRIFTSGRCVPQKGIDIILRAISLIPTDHRIEFHLMGDGENKQEYLNLAKEILKLNQCFIIHGWEREIDYAAIADKFDLFISASRQEGLSFSLLEAATTGFPMICSNCAGNIELIETCDRGFLFERENYLQLSGLIADFLSNPEELNNKAIMNTFCIDKKFNISKLIKQLEEIYKSALNNV